MAYCPKCGVELEPTARHCPLCGTVSPEAVQPAPAGDPSASATSADSAPLTPKEENTIQWEVITVSAFISSVVVLAVNLLIERRFSWALYPLASIMLVWIVLTAIVEFRRLKLFGVALAAVAIPLFLCAVDLGDGPITWALDIGLPISLAAELSVIAIILLGAKAGRRPVAYLALTFLGASFVSLAVDSTIALHLQHRFTFTWSYVVAATLVPISVFLLYLHFRVSKVADMRRFFRL